MTARAEYTEEEWALLYTAPIIVALAVSYAEPGGLTRELLSVVAMEGMASQRYPGNELLGALWSANTGRPTLEPPAPLDPTRLSEQTLERALDACRRVTPLLEERSSLREAEEYRRFLADVAVAAAEATRTGGFLGFGGVLVSPAERGAVNAIRDALGLGPMPEGQSQDPPAPDTTGGGPDVPSGAIHPE